LAIYKLYNAFTATAEGAVSVDIQFDGIITALTMHAHGDLDADGETYFVETSFLSGNTIASNDARGSLITVGEQASGTGANSHVSLAVSGLRIPVSSGERIHMHGILTGTADVKAQCYIYVEDNQDPRIRRRR